MVMSGTNAFEYDKPGQGIMPTPGPGRATTAHQRLVVQFVSGLLHHDVNPERLAADLMMQPVEVQREVGKFLFAMLGLWSEMGEYTQPSHPLAYEYSTARKMVHNLFT